MKKSEQVQVSVLDQEFRSGWGKFRGFLKVSGNLEWMDIFNFMNSFRSCHSDVCVCVCVCVCLCLLHPVIM